MPRRAAAQVHGILSNEGPFYLNYLCIAQFIDFILGLVMDNVIQTQEDPNNQEYNALAGRFWLISDHWCIGLIVWLDCHLEHINTHLMFPSGTNVLCYNNNPAIQAIDQDLVKGKNCIRQWIPNNSNTISTAEDAAHKHIRAAHPHNLNQHKFGVLLDLFMHNIYQDAFGNIYLEVPLNPLPMSHPHLWYCTPCLRPLLSP
jgi:hypothetical protein